LRWGRSGEDARDGKGERKRTEPEGGGFHTHEGIYLWLKATQGRNCKDTVKMGHGTDTVAYDATIFHLKFVIKE
jgi:hypothetical protein